MGEVDPAFVQEPEHRPKLRTIEAEGIPIIDLSILSSSDANPDHSRALENLVKQVGNACRDWGFFQVINHGVSLEKREKIFNVSRKFYAQPLEERNKIRKDDKKMLGYNDAEHTKNVRDWKEVFDLAVQNPILMSASYKPDDKEITEWHNQWPEYPPELREVCEDYVKEMEKLAYKLLELIALSLSLQPDRFHGFYKDKTAYMRLNHYRPCPAPHLALGIGRHKDSGALTILAQDDVQGLEVKRKSDGEWTLVKPTPSSYIINVGDIMQTQGSKINMLDAKPHDTLELSTLLQFGSFRCLSKVEPGI
ncbi:protein DOWNY MILDEW RESISTANCE 6 isoform X3 [Manihot esculenta]|uniref:protein DOWNY MILDEW RESISTANCE 6 isoform X3 n=1 Tax=Manihot esculenta TaxID=3983 RepID=UPI001CC7F773|nr:protein DOWNY MILDEW RESISTANCE 6 isoform X3 [Manihot esculenta]